MTEVIDSQQSQTSQVPAIRQPTPMASFEEMRAQANVLVESGFLPKSLDTPEKALAVMLRGRELGLPPMVSVSGGLFPVHGAVQADSQTILALIFRSGLLEDISFEETDDSCTMTMKRKGIPSAYTTTWSSADDKRAGFANKDTYRKFGKDMHRARCILRGGRALFPDISSHLYGWEELSGESPFSTLPTATLSREEGLVVSMASEERPLLDESGEEKPVGLAGTPVSDWLDFTRAAVALGRSPKEALYLLECSDIPEAKAKFGTPQATLDALKEVLDSKEAADRRESILTMISGLYSKEIPELEKMGIVKFVDQRLSQEPGLDTETFDLSELVKEDGSLYGEE